MANKCRFCATDISKHPIISIENQALSAQGFASSREIALRNMNIEIYECEACGLIQHLHSPVPYYKDVIRAVAYSKEMKNYRNNQFKEFCDTYKLHKRTILEVGAGQGEYLELFRDIGVEDLYAIENGKENFSALRNKNFNAARKFLGKNFNNPWEKQFDAIVTFNFMEHWPDLKSGLVNIRNLLKNDGVALLEVPNFDYMVKNDVYSEFTIDHVFYFTEQSLRTILSVAGFEIIQIKSIWHDYILSAEVRKRAGSNLNSLRQKKEDDKLGLIEYLRSRTGRTVVWGAGHQSLSILSMVEAQNYVEFVVDSAPFKQNMFCPGTGLPIYPPDHLLENVPETLIIMAAAYSDEVLTTVKDMYPHIKEVRIFDHNGWR